MRLYFWITQRTFWRLVPQLNPHQLNEHLLKVCSQAWDSLLLRGHVFKELLSHGTYHFCIPKCKVWQPSRCWGLAFFLPVRLGFIFMERCIKRVCTHCIYLLTSQIMAKVVMWEPKLLTNPPWETVLSVVAGGSPGSLPLKDPGHWWYPAAVWHFFLDCWHMLHGFAIGNYLQGMVRQLRCPLKCSNVEIASTCDLS